MNTKLRKLTCVQLARQQMLEGFKRSRRIYLCLVDLEFPPGTWVTGQSVGGTRVIGRVTGRAHPDGDLLNLQTVHGWVQADAAKLRKL